MKITVAELIRKLEQMPQDVYVAIATDTPGQTDEDIQVSLEKCVGGDYVFIGDY
jgi:hypothetical protein